jgi:hypothetical protein
MKQALLNISDFDNEWNRSVLDKGWKEREARWAGPKSQNQQPPEQPETHPGSQPTIVITPVPTKKITD